MDDSSRESTELAPVTSAIFCSTICILVAVASFYFGRLRKCDMDRLYYNVILVFLYQITGR